MRLLVGAVDLFPALVEAIDAAQHDVWLETYIFSMAGAGADVAEALMAAIGEFERQAAMAKPGQ